MKMQLFKTNTWWWLNGIQDDRIIRFPSFDAALEFLNLKAN